MASDDTTPVIQCAENGPYIVKNLKTLSGPDGGRIATKDVIALCRCGGSAKKPFCDGTHARNGFSGARASDGSNDRRDAYRGKRITIFDNRAICAHAGVCTDTLASVWRMDEEPWIDPDGAAVEAIVETIRNCPSGALSYAIEGTEGPQPGAAAAIHATPDGPYRVTGGVALEGVAWAEGSARDRFTLCRCGASKNKPFCDGSHWDAGFKDPAP